MPRAKRPKGQPSFISRGHPLGDTAKAKLLELLGADAAPLIIGDIEAALGICVHGAKHLDNPPRPADYVRAFKSLQSKSFELWEELSSLNYYYDRLLSRHGADQNNIAVELVKLAEVSRAIVKEYEGKSSKGAKTNFALLETIRRLKSIFHNNYRGPVTGRRTKGATESLSKEEKREVEFITTALREVRFIRTDRALHRLIFHDSRSTLPHERSRFIEHLARHARKSSLPYTFPEPDGPRLARARRQKRNVR